MPRTNSKHKPSTQEPVVNPYQAFTAPEFDSWIAKLTGTLQAALQGSETLAPHSVQWKDTDATRLIGNGMTSNLSANASAYTNFVDADTVGVVEDVSFELREEDGSLAVSETSVSEDTGCNQLSGALESHLWDVYGKEREAVHHRHSANSETPIAQDQPHQDVESVSLQGSAPSDAPVIMGELKTASKLERSAVVNTPPVKISTSAKISWGMAGSTKRDETTQDLAPTFSLCVASVPQTPRLPHKETPVATTSLFDLPPTLGGPSSLSANSTDKLSFAFQGSAHARSFTDRMEHGSSDIRARDDEEEAISEDGMEEDELQSDAETASEGIQLRRHQEVQTNTDYTTDESDSQAIQSDGEEDQEEGEEGEDDDGREREYYGQMGDKYSYSSEEPQDYSEGDVQEYGQDQVMYDDEEEYESSNDQLPPSREKSGVSSVREEDGILILDSSDEEEDDRVDSWQENSNQARIADLEKKITEEMDEEYEEQEEDEEEYDEEYEYELADDDQQFATKQAHLSPKHALECYLTEASSPSDENLSFDGAEQSYMGHYHGERSDYSSETEDDELSEAPETSLAALASLHRQYSTQPHNQRSHADQSQFSRMANLDASAPDTFGKDGGHGAVLEPSSLEQETDHPTSLAAEGQELSEADLHLQEMEEYHLLHSPKDAAILEEGDEEDDEDEEEDYAHMESHNYVTHGEEMSDNHEDDEVSVEAHNDIEQKEENGVRELPVVATRMEREAVQEDAEKEDAPAGSLQETEQSHLSELQGAELSNVMTPESQPRVESMREDNLKLNFQSLETPFLSQFASIPRSETTVDFATPDTLPECGMDDSTTMDLIADEYLQTPGSEESANESLSSEIDSASVEQGQGAVLKECDAMAPNVGALTTPAQVKETEDTSDDNTSDPGGANGASHLLQGEDAEHQAEEFSEHERRVHYRSPGVVKYLVDYYDKIIQSEAASAVAQGGKLSDEQEARGGQGDAVKDTAATTTGGGRIVSLQGEVQPSPIGKRHDSVLSPADRSQKRKRTADSRGDDASAAIPNRKSAIFTIDRETRSQKRRTSDLSPQTPIRSLRSRATRSTTPSPKAKKTHLDANVTPGSERSFFDARSHLESDGEDENTAFSNAPDTVSTNMLHSLISKHDCDADHNELLAILNDGRIDQENDTSSSTPEEDLHVFWMFEDEKSEGEHAHDHHHHHRDHNENSERKSGVQSSYYLRSKCPLRKLILARRGGEKQYYVGKRCWIEQEGANPPQESPRKRKREPSMEDVKPEKATREDEHRFEDVKLEGTPTVLDHIAPEFLRSAKKVNRRRRSPVAQDMDDGQISSPSPTPTPSRTVSTDSSTQAGDASKNPKPKPTRRSSRLASEELQSVSDDDQEELLNAPPPALSTRSHAKSHSEGKQHHEKMPTSTAPSTLRKKQTRKKQQEPRTSSKASTNRVLRHHR